MARAASRRLRLRGLAALLVLAGLLGGCGSGGAGGGASAPTASAATSAGTDAHAHASLAKSCRRIGITDEGPLWLCPAEGEHGVVAVGEGDEAERLPIPPPSRTSADAGRVGHWAWAALSPDGETLLAQWSSECDSPTAFFVSLPAGSPRPVTGETDWARSPASEALGWTKNGRAVVFLPNRATCGSEAARPGLYLYQAPGAGERLLAAHGASTSSVRRALSPRSEDAIAHAGP